MNISESDRDGKRVLGLSGRLDSNTAPDIETSLPQAIEANPATIVDLSEVNYVSSAGLRVLLKGAKVAKGSGNRLVLCGLSPSVREVFDISGFSSIFAIEADLEAALAAAG